MGALGSVAAAASLGIGGDGGALGAAVRGTGIGDRWAVEGRGLRWGVRWGHRSVGGHRSDSVGAAGVGAGHRWGLQ